MSQHASPSSELPFSEEVAEQIRSRWTSSQDTCRDIPGEPIEFSTTDPVPAAYQEMAGQYINAILKAYPFNVRMIFGRELWVRFLTRYAETVKVHGDRGAFRRAMRVI